MMTRSLRRFPSRREVARGLLGAGLGLGTLTHSRSTTTEAKKKRKKRKKPAQPQAPQPPPPQSTPPPPPPVCAPLGGSCTPGQSLCCEELLCIGVPVEMIEPAVAQFSCCKKQGAACGASDECCASLLLTCVEGICRPIL
jgi:hypothetical protein